MKLKTLLAPLLIGALAFAIAGCGSTSNQSTQTQKEIKIGAIVYTAYKMYLKALLFLSQMTLLMVVVH